MVRALAPVLLLVLSTTHVFGGNWPRFRGENGRGQSDDKNVPVQFDGKKPLWQVNLPGPGNASPIVWDGKIFLQSTAPDGSERKFVCLSLDTGKELWSKEAPGGSARTHKKNTLASGTAATDGQRVYVPFWNGSEMAIVAYDFKGNEVWTHNLGSFVSQHGAGHSPIVVGDKVVISNDQDGRSTLVALKAETGKIAWETPRPASRACSYSTPLLIDAPAMGEVIIACNTLGFGAYDPNDGREVWKWEWVGNGLRTVGSPIFGQGLLVVGSGNGAGNRNTVAVKAGEISPSALAWEEKKTIPYVPTMLVKGEHLYFINDNGLAGCRVLKTGEDVWELTRLGGNFSASPVMIDGRIYAVNEQGEVFVLDASPTYKLLHRTAVDDTVYASPAVADGRFLIRGQTKLFCFGK
jgi:outer membrane protein assembly factor BamB